MLEVKANSLFSNRSSKPQHQTERRVVTPSENTENQKLNDYFSGFSFGDVFTAKSHSTDFREARAEYIVKRLRFMLLFFILAVPAWIPIDYLTLETLEFKSIASARVIVTVTLLAILILSLAKPKHRSSNTLLALTFITPCAFYLFSMMILRPDPEVNPLAGYSAMPYLMTALLGLYPVTLVFAFLMLSLIIASFTGFELWAGTLIDRNTLSTLWVLFMLCGIVVWVQTGQLLMLLKLYRESSCDPLTGLINRRVLMKSLTHQAEKSAKFGTTFTLLMLDLDRFKRINDTYGHLSGDRVLKKCAEVLLSNLRKNDIVARYGGEEFLVVLPDIKLDQGLETAERIRRSIEAAWVNDSEDNAIVMTTSIGAIEFDRHESIEHACNRVDELLYLAKEKGRNCVVSPRDKSEFKALAD
ncbi:MAG: GGDEF domain-containing protein [Motiliproteus sp.]|nr:GGDEF domain-containing protein [Motiliproteus sp.]